MNAVRRHALALLERTTDDLSDVELMNRSQDDYYYIGLCLDKLHRLPSEIDAIIGCREYTLIQANGVVSRAMQDMTRQFTGSHVPQGA